MKRHFYERGVAVFAYTDGIKQSIYQFKYHDKREYAAFYGRQAAQQCGALIGKWDIDLCFPYRCMQPNKENADTIRQN